MQNKLYTLDEVAALCNRHPTALRKYYAAGILPEPTHCIVHKKKTTRRFTLQEAEALQRMFQKSGWGTFAAKTERARRRKINAPMTRVITNYVPHR